MFRRGLALGVLSATALVVLAGAAGGGEPTFSFSYSPQSGPPGTVITVSGSGCFGEGDTHVEVVLSTQGASGTLVTSAFSAVIPANTEPGSWTVMITVPAGTLPGTYDLQAFCEPIESGGDGVSAFQVNPSAGTCCVTYALANFVVTAPVPPTAPPTAPPAVAPADAPAPPAPPVAATPRTAG